MSFAEKIQQRRQDIKQDSDITVYPDIKGQLLEYAKSIRKATQDFTADASYNEIFSNNDFFVKRHLSPWDTSVSIEHKSFKENGPDPRIEVYIIKKNKENSDIENYNIENIDNQVEMMVSIQTMKEQHPGKRVFAFVDNPREAADKFSSIIANYVADNTQDPELSSTLKASDWW